MAAYLLTWNPDCWDITDFVVTLHQTGRATSDWTTQSRKIREGDRIVFLRQGVEPRGIVGLGRATGRPWKGTGRRWYCPIAWAWLEPKRPVLTVAELQELIPSGHWVPRCSGTRIGPVEEAVLFDHLRARLSARLGREL